MRGTFHQRGWVGLVVLLLALAIVAFLAQTALKRYGLLPDDRASATTKTAGPRGVGPTTPMSVDPTGVTPVPGNAIERARGLESSLQQQTQDMGQRIDAQTK
jgi:hypothetical protein